MDRSSFRIGQKVGDFLILEAMGKGGMAELYLARDETLGRKVVIKTLPPFQTQALQERFLSEARVQADLDNPYILQIFGAMTVDGNLCLVMQHAPGTDLDSVIQAARIQKEQKRQWGALSVERSLHIFLQILEGVGFAHKYRIIHGDLKPANILLDRQGRAKIADFGLAFSLRHAKEPDPSALSQAGTPHYMSPEQILGRDVDLRSDIYSLGVTLFTMITGKFPHGEKRAPLDLLEWHMEGSLEEARAILNESGKIPVRIQDAILKALDNDPGARHQSTLAFALAIKEEAPQEMYSELLRMSLQMKTDLTPSERSSLDRIARKKSLSLEEARRIEANIRSEMGLPPIHREL